MMMKAKLRLAASVAMTGLAASALIGISSTASAQTSGHTTGQTDAERRAAETVKAMTPAEKIILTKGIMPIPLGPDSPKPPADAIPGAGYVPGIPRLGLPALKETDASLGVSWVAGIRGDGATALPSGLAQASSWNPDLVRRAGAMIGAEARAKGFNVLLAGGINLVRDPRNGRNFEYFSEDPLLSGLLAGNAIAGIQSNNIISTIKHLALNGQETGRKGVDIRISDAAARESDLLAFQIGIEVGNPGSVMCAYNPVNGEPSCSSPYLLNRVLKQDWGYKGFVMSDWGAVPSLDAAINGLDQQSAAELDPAPFFGKPLAEAAAKDPAWARRLDDMNKRVIWAIYANGLDKHPVSPGGAIDFEAHGTIAEEAARQGIVLLRNRGDALPLSKSAKSIAVIGSYAKIGVLSGGGSSQVHMPGGPAAIVPLGEDSPFAAIFPQGYHRSSPYKAIEAMAPQAKLRYRDGSTITDAVEEAKRAEVAIIFASKWDTEGRDSADLSLPYGQDALIAAVAAANPNTIVVLQTGNPVKMPWLDKTAAVLQAWYPGGRGGEAIASILFGETNPSGRLPVTFPANESQLPRPVVDGFYDLEPNFQGNVPKDVKISADYDIEGSNLGYRWNALKGHKALFPFGYGLSYTRFETGGLTLDGLDASLTVKNIGAREGANVAQLYLVSVNGTPKQRLVGFQRVTLAPGASQQVSMRIDPRLLAEWDKDGWSIAGGTYGFALGEDAETLGPITKVKVAPRRWKD